MNTKPCLSWIGHLSCRLMAIALISLGAHAASVNTSKADGIPIEGAQKLLDQFKSLQDRSAVSKDSKANSELSALGKDLAAFPAKPATMPPAAAAAMWLDLYDRFKKLPKAQLESYDSPLSEAEKQGVSMLGLVEALPPPSSWPALGDLIRSQERKASHAADHRLAAFVGFLLADTEGTERELKKLRDEASEGRDWLRRRLNPVRHGGAGTGSKFKLSSKAFSDYLRQLEETRREGRIRVVVPDLVSIAGEAQSESLILRALKLPGVTISVPSGGATHALAKKIAKRQIKSLVEPQWELVTGINDVELYEALAARFPETAKKDMPRTAFEKRPDEYQPDFQLPGRSPKDIARVHYLFGLIALGKNDAAVKTAHELSASAFGEETFERAWRAFDKGRHASSINRFCLDLLRQRPELSLWSQCAAIAAAQRQGEELLALARSALAEPGKSLASRSAMRHRLLDVLLAMDRVEDALTELRLGAQGAAPGVSEQAASAEGKHRLKLALRLGTLGQALDREELIAEAEALVARSLGAGGTREGSGGEDFSRDWYESDRSITEFVEILLERGRYGGAERVLLALFREQTAALTMGKEQAYRDAVLLQGHIAKPVALLAAVYDQAGRHLDVLVLLDQFGGWGSPDLIAIADRVPEIMVPAARALHKTGRSGVAAEVLKLHLQARPQDDRAFALLVELLGLSAKPWLEALYARDRFEERPLIWKAHLLLQANQLDEAETTIRQALKVDPTDGEQKAGDRARAYAVLAAVLRSKGKAEEATFFDKVVEAVRLAEAGDRLSKAGLVQRSLKVYEKASWLFADAYCVQWRLAERLVAMGSMEEAKKHYQIAFERMPEQFGQVANVCFGCEGVFTHRESMSVAEEVLTRIAKASPERPQIHYLLGQLRNAQGRMIEAYQNYRRASSLDPDYLDAWREAYRLRKDILLSDEETNEIAIKMLSLDPMGRHSADTFDDVSDLSTLWSIFERAAARNLPIPDTLYPLNASSLGIERYYAKVGMRFDLLGASRSNLVRSRSAASPGGAIARVGFVREALGIRNYAGWY
ncbi:hypothetical protein BURK2_01737 [Burkholderiales bacterium]|nr:MAG: hypothetical protein F9K47_00660 [Burkholderiales bacterium]CAG0979063.1 hypothetical protein BURK2_01737 [Burkholderiales bacterium]